MNFIECDVCIIGCGAGGIGAAIGAAEAGARVVVVEQSHLPGGTVAKSWVLNWEPTCGNSPVSRRLWRRMDSYPMAVPEGCEFTTRCKYPGGGRLPGMPFEQWAYLRALDEEFAAFDRLKLFQGLRFLSSKRNGRRIESIVCLGNGSALEIKAGVFIDSSGDIALAREAGCAFSLGSDARADYGEPDAPLTGSRGDLNEVNLIFRVRPMGRPVKVDPSPVPESCRKLGIAACPMPNGDIVVNICGQGRFNPEQPEDYARTFREQRRIAFDIYRWHVLSEEHPDWSLTGFAPELGIRETFRLKARYVLTENDILAGYAAQSKRGFVGATDHILDVHGTDLGQRLQTGAFGIPYECLQAVEFDNLLVACRGLGVSHIAGGSCRLSRVMTALGEAAGRAAALSVECGIPLEDIEPERIAVFEPPSL